MNFSGGPGALPESILRETRDAIRALPEVGLSVLGVSHRSDWFREIVAEGERNVRNLLGVGPEFRVLFLQGGSTLQFSMIPMNLLPGAQAPAEYLRTGYWSAKSIPEAQREGPIRVLWDGASMEYRRLPHAAELDHAPDAPYFHYISNETVEGVQFHEIPGRDDVTRICDMSSDFLSRPIDARRFGLIYAHSQKNLGPAGVTLVLLHEDLLARMRHDLPSMLDYHCHAEADSIFNTPPVFAIYVTVLVTRWLRDEIGGLEAMDRINRGKAATLYEAIDASDGFYRGHADAADRSLMNVSFRLPTPELEARFLATAEAAGMYGLGGHRSLGGVRASIYNAVTPDETAALHGFMEEFRMKEIRADRLAGVS